MWVLYGRTYTSVDMCIPSGKPDGTVRCVYPLTQLYYSWTFILKISQWNKISTWTWKRLCGLTLQQFLNSSCSTREFCEHGWKRIISVISLLSSWNASFLLQLCGQQTIVVPVVPMILSARQSKGIFVSIIAEILEVSFIFITSLKFTGYLNHLKILVS